MNIPPVVADVLKAVAPTLALALGGPLGPAAAAIASAALNAWLPGSATPESPAPAVTPGALVKTIEANRDDPSLIVQLRQVEADLQKFERDQGFRFADLEQKDRQSARDATRDSGMAHPQFLFGMGVVVLSMTMLFGIVAGCIAALTGRLSIDPASTNIAIAAFGLLGTVTGVFQAVSSQILAFYFGSSAGSAAKNDQITATMRDMGAALGSAAKAGPGAGASAPVVVVPPLAPAQPAPAPPVDQAWQQGPHGGARWKLTTEGVLVEGEAAPLRTVGIPATARRVWQQYGRLIHDACARIGCPLEIAVACICTESRGRADAVLVEPDGRASGGLFQVLTGTAAEMLGRDVSIEELKRPEVSIEAGVLYLAKQRQTTAFQPPLCAAAFNAGGLYRSSSNRWNLRSTGDHIDRFCQFYGDAVAVAHEDGWAAQVAAWSAEAQPALVPPKPGAEPAFVWTAPAT